MTCKHLSATERDSKIMKILEQFELTHSAHVAIGTPGIFSHLKKKTKKSSNIQFPIVLFLWKWIRRSKDTEWWWKKTTCIGHRNLDRSKTFILRWTNVWSWFCNCSTGYYVSRKFIKKIRIKLFAILQTKFECNPFTNWKYIMHSNTIVKLKS